MNMLGNIKRLLRSYLPATVMEWHQRRANAQVQNMTPQEVFEKYYCENRWGSEESRSGGGSTLAATVAAREALENLVRRLDIHLLHDIPCGDFNWMRHVDLGGCRYIGSDIVPQLIEQNRAAYAAPHREFSVRSLCSDPLPRADLVLVRDCLIHLSFADIRLAFRNLKRSESTYLLASTYAGHRRNYDTITGGARPVNLCAAPLSFPKPIELISETIVLDNADDPLDKCLGLWRIADLPIA